MVDTAAQEPLDILGMSDEDFENLNSPADIGQVTEGEPAPITPAAEGEAAPAAVTEPEAGAAAPTGSGEGEGAAAPAVIESEPTPTPTPEAKPAEVSAEAAPADGDEKPEEPKPVTVAAPSAEDAQAFYQKIMTPFKANGKMIELRSPEEAIGLMQMGANFTRKMQELAPHRKAMLMLQNNNLLDAEKLSFLIDLDKGDPEAVKKFIKDRGIDPLDIDTSTDPAYLGGRHQVSDEEAAFRETTAELGSTPEGRETLQTVATTWDEASKEVLWKNPGVFNAIHEQRESGVYDLITAEIDRQKTLGTLSANVPFLQAYKAVGDQLVAQQQGQPPANPGTATPTPTPAPQVIATRTATPKATIEAGDRAAAASPSRGTAATAKEPVNFLAMSDDAFLKQMENRV